MLGSQHPPMNRMTDRCKNITLPQTSSAGSNKKAFQWDAYHPLLWFRGLGGYTLTPQISYPSSGYPTPIRNMRPEITPPQKGTWDQRYPTPEKWLGTRKGHNPPTSGRPPVGRPPSRRMQTPLPLWTNTCENITLPQTSSAGGKMAW